MQPLLNFSYRIPTLELHLLALEGVSTEPNLFLPIVNGDLNGVLLDVALSKFVSSDCDHLHAR